MVRSTNKYFNITLILLSFCMLFSSCNDDEDINPALITGKWNFVKTEGMMTVEGKKQTMTDIRPEGMYFDFKENGDLVIKNQSSFAYENNAWRIEGNKLFIDGYNNIFNAHSGLTIKKLTTGELRLYTSHDDGGLFEYTHFLSK